MFKTLSTAISTLEKPRLRGILAAGLIGLLAVSAEAATKLDAPVRMLMKGLNRVAVLEAVEKNDELKITFLNRQTLYGEAVERVTLRMDEATHADVEVGSTYVVGFSNIRRNFRFRELREVDPAGFRVLGVLDGGPALFENTAAVRRLFAAPGTDSAPSTAVRLAATLEVLGSHDPRTRFFGVLELRHRPELYGQIEEKHLKTLRGLLRDPTSGPELSNNLLETAVQISEKRKVTWLAKESREILREVDPQFDLSSFYPRLVTTALTVLETEGRKADASYVARFLGANNPGVVKAALKSLDQLDADLARKRAAALLARDDLHSESRRALAAYLG